ncbi:MAG: NADH-quinone oxidoreductase subunit N [Desulfuromonas sp.]|nr:MAG: NADH-quinone oxidoreductase subunit N [Desulfuromonas sp.]
MTLSDLHALLPQLILALGATGILMVGAWWPSRAPWVLTGVALSFCAAISAGIVLPTVTEVGGMFGVTPYARFFTILWSILTGLTLLLSLRYAKVHRFAGAEYTALVLFAGAGMSLLSAASSLVGLFLGLETFTLVLYILIAFNRGEAIGAEAGLKYLVMGAVATGFLAFGIALIYASSGSFHLPEAMHGLQIDGQMRPLGLLGWAMLLVAIGFKVSLVPFHLWTPDVYQGAPAPVTGLLATGAKGAMFAALIPLFAALGTLTLELNAVLAALAMLSMVGGTLAALPQRNLKRMLAYSSVVHMGYLLLGLMSGGPDGQRAVIFYLIVYGIATLGAFGVITSFAQADGEPQDYETFRGLGYRHPRRCSALSAFLLSLAGIPPLAGFFGKFGIFHAALKSNHHLLALVGILAALVSVSYYLRPIIVLFMQERPAQRLRPGCTHEFAVLTVCFSLVLYLGLYPGPLLELISQILPSP